MDADVITFPGGRPAVGGAGWWVRTKGRMRVGLGLALRRLGVAGMVGPVEVNDTATGQTIVVTIGTLYTRLSVNGRDYYFDRFTGRFDGTGQGCS